MLHARLEAPMSGGPALTRIPRIGVRIAFPKKEAGGERPGPRVGLPNRDKQGDVT
jgi:hypothetical protein